MLPKVQPKIPKKKNGNKI